MIVYTKMLTKFGANHLTNALTRTKKIDKHFQIVKKFERISSTSSIRTSFMDDPLTYRQFSTYFVILSIGCVRAVWNILNKSSIQLINSHSYGLQKKIHFEY